MLLLSFSALQFLKLWRTETAKWKVNREMYKQFNKVVLYLLTVVLILLSMSLVLPFYFYSPIHFPILLQKMCILCLIYLHVYFCIYFCILLHLPFAKHDINT